MSTAPAALLVWAWGGLQSAMAATPGTPGVAVPLYALDGTCADRRFPRLAGDWAIGCDKGGMLDHAIHLLDGRSIRIDPPLDPRHTAVSAGPTDSSAVLVEVADRTRVVDLRVTGATDRTEVTRLPAAPIAPPTTTARHFAALLPDRVEALAHNTRVRPTFAASPVAWYPPALAWPHVAWVERNAQQRETVWVVQTHPPADPHPILESTHHQRHVVSDGTTFVWVDGGQLRTWNPETDQQQVIPAATGFHAPPTISGGVVCWEERRDPPGSARPRADIDILCTDGLSAAGPGDQLFPSRSGPWLLYRSAGHTWLRTAP